MDAISGRDAYISGDVMTYLQDLLIDGLSVDQALRVKLGLPLYKVAEKKTRAPRYKFPVADMEIHTARVFTDYKSFNSVFQSVMKQGRDLSRIYECSWTKGGIKVTRKK